MENANGKTFSSKDFYISAFLLAKGHKIIKVDRTNPNKVFFVFSDFEGRENLVRDFLYHKAVIEPQSFITGIKALKQLIYSYD